MSDCDTHCPRQTVTFMYCILSTIPILILLTEEPKRLLTSRPDGRQFSQMIGTLIVPRGKTQLVRKGMKAATYLP